LCLSEAGKEIGREALTNGEIGLQMLSWLNTGVNAYTNYDQEQDAEDTAALQAKLDAQDEELTISMTPKAAELIKYNFESYTFLDTNATMENIPYVLTQGKIDIATTKYYS